MSDRASSDPAERDVRVAAWAFLCAWLWSSDDIDTCDAAEALLAALLPGQTDAERAAIADRLTRGFAVPLPEEAQP
jgi:hypothetical protein